MITKFKLIVSHVISLVSTVSLFDIQKHLAKVVILFPMMLLIIYLAIFSQHRYMSESKVAIKRSDDINGGNLNVGLLLGGANPSSAEDALYLKEFITSPDMLDLLDKQLNFREAFSHSGLDFLNHLSKDETAEGFLQYYK
ncbi:capsule biosynthesis protein, partial [Escherichia coli]